MHLIIPKSSGNKWHYWLCAMIWLSITLLNKVSAQQIADTSYNPIIEHPVYEQGQGPVIFIDEGHYNFHTREGRYLPFARLLEKDGYRVESNLSVFQTPQLNQCKILVVSNALHVSDTAEWALPTQSAFTPEEIKTLTQWVHEGGSLFLIADHMPMAGAASDLARSFGFKFTNGFAMNPSGSLPSIFSTLDKTLAVNTVTNGRNKEEKVSRIGTFTGQAFQIPEDAIPILTFDETHINLLPEIAWEFNEHTRRQIINGWHQGAYKAFGKGRVVIFGEAAMFSAQLSGSNKFKFGMNHPDVPQNYQLLLNIIHWLDGLY